MTPSLVLIAAVGRNGSIGVENGLPWQLPADMRHFRALTMGKPVILGRKTWQSIGRPLPGRVLIVVSGDPTFAPPPDVQLARNPEEAVARGQAIAADRKVDEVMVAGGATIYAALIDRAARLYLTEVDLAPEADAFFPSIDPARWREAARQPQIGSDAVAFAFVTYARC